MDKVFTDEEFESSDPFFQFHKGDHEYMAFKNIAFAVDHSHENNSVLITQRFTQTLIGEEGMSEEKPHQVSIIVPQDQLTGLILHLIANDLCLKDREQDDNHEG